MAGLQRSQSPWQHEAGWRARDAILALARTFQGVLRLLEAQRSMSTTTALQRHDSPPAHCNNRGLFCRKVAAADLHCRVPAYSCNSVGRSRAAAAAAPERLTHPHSNPETQQHSLRDPWRPPPVCL